jgi:hypothetical protein
MVCRQAELNTAARPEWRVTHRVLFALAGLLAVPSWAAGVVSPNGAGAKPVMPWREVLLPRQKPPATAFSVVALDNERVLRVQAKGSYGTLVHRITAAHASAKTLAWQWRVDVAPSGDLRTREGDDVALKVCAAFDWPTERLPTLDRIKLETARAVAGADLPSAVLCYVWHPSLKTGTVLPNAYTRRLRMIVLQGEGAALATWQAQERDLHADFKLAFADEWRDGDTVPPVQDVIVGGDADNTNTEGLAYLRALRLLP